MWTLNAGRAYSHLTGSSGQLSALEIFAGPFGAAEIFALTARRFRRRSAANTIDPLATRTERRIVWTLVILPFICILSQATFLQEAQICCAFFRVPAFYMD